MTTHLKLGEDPHPEQPSRIVRIWKTLVEKEYTKKMLWLPIRTVRREEALLVHTEDHWDKVQAIQCKKSLSIEPGCQPEFFT